jgi:hypothetical protein
MDPLDINTTSEYGDDLQIDNGYFDHNSENNTFYIDDNFSVLFDNITIFNIRDDFKFFTLDELSPGFWEILGVIALVIGSLGLVGNLCTIIKIWSDKKFHTPTFAAIVCLAFADFLSLIRCYFSFYANVYEYLGDNVLGFYVFDIVNLMVFTSSMGHMVLLSVVRYLIIVHPLQSKIHLSVLVVTLWSLTLWIISFIFAVFESHLLGRNPWTTNFNIWGYIILYLIRAAFPVCMITILHCLKMKYLKTSRVTGKTKAKMNLTITIIMSVFFLMQAVTIAYFTSEILNHYGIIGYFLDKEDILCMVVLLHIVHHSCNPYVYFIVFICCRCK